MNYKYRKHVRYQGFDYSQPGDYFITLCSAKLQCTFSRIHKHVVCLLPLGNIIEQQWLKLSHRFQCVKLGAHVIMPNHFHGIISIKKHPRKINLSSIVQSFKTSCSLEAKKSLFTKNGIWQPNYYDQIINDEFHYYFVEEYILSNPENWQKDKLFENI